MLFTLANPMTWVHFQLRGGRRNLTTTMIAYVVLVGGLIMISLRADQTARVSILDFWTKALLTLQLAVLVMFAPRAILNSIRKDIATRMLESHRLMPVPATQAVLGLMAGSTIQFVCMLIATYLVGSMTWSAAGGVHSDWMLANAICIIFGLSFWFASTLMAFMPASGIGLMSIGVIASLMSGGAVMRLLPALGVLASPVMGRSVYGLLARGGGWSWEYQVAAVAQVFAAAICYLAAVRKYRREDQLAFTPVMGLILTAGWGMLSCVAVQNPDAFEGRVWGERLPRQPDLAAVGSIISTLLLAIVPVSSAAWLSALWQRRRQLGDRFLPLRPVPVNVIVLTATLILCVVAAGMPSPRGARRIEPVLMLGLSSGALLTACGYLLRIQYRVSARVGLPLLLLLGIVLGGPLLLDLIRYAGSSRVDVPLLTGLSACSPAGLAWCLWSQVKVPYLPGLVVQMLPPLILGILYHRSQRRIVASAATIDASPPAA